MAKKNHPAVGILIKEGANVNLQNKQRLTALYVNSGPGDEEMLDLLLEAGVIVTPLVDLPAKMALVSMTVTLSRSALDFAADEAKACNCLGSSMVTT